MGCISKIKFDCIVGDGAHASIKRVEDGIPYLTSKNFKLEGIDLSDLSFISKSDYEKHFKEKSKALTKPRPKDIIFSIIGSIGSPYIVRETDSFGISSSVAILRPLENLDTKYLYYYLKNSGVQNYVEAIKSGSAQGFLSLEMIKSIPLDYPPLPEQQRIASILSAYDDLIEVNNKRIALLEQMAEQIYKEWFVRMRFPGYQDAEFEKGVPKGWEVKKVEQLVKRKKFGNTYNKDSVLKDGKVIVVDQSKNELLGFHDNAPDHLASIAKPMIIFGDHTCKMQMLLEPFSLGENVVPFTNSDGVNIYFLYYTIHSLIETSEYKRHWNELIVKKVFLPKDDLQQQFGDLIKPMLAQKNQLWKINFNLKLTRDLLLPRLISGKLRVKDIPEPQTISA